MRIYEKDNNNLCINNKKIIRIIQWALVIEFILANIWDSFFTDIDITIIGRMASIVFIILPIFMFIIVMYYEYTIKILKQTDEITHVYYRFSARGNYHISHKLSALTAVKKPKKVGVLYTNPKLVINGKDYKFTNFEYALRDHSNIAKEIADFAGVPLVTDD